MSVLRAPVEWTADRVTRKGVVWHTLYKLGLDLRECDYAVEAIDLDEQAGGDLWSSLRMVVISDGLPEEGDVAQREVPLIARLAREQRVRAFLMAHGVFVRRYANGRREAT